MDESFGGGYCLDSLCICGARYLGGS